MPKVVVNTPDAPGLATYGSLPNRQEAVKAAGLDFVAGHPLEVEWLRISIALVAEA